jgi:hypothetical protein
MSSLPHDTQNRSEIVVPGSVSNTFWQHVDKDVAFFFTTSPPAGYLDRMAHRTSAAAGRAVWTLEVQDHALGRLLQRDPTADIDDALWEAHSSALNMNLEFVPADTSFFLPAGNGGFLARLEHTRNRVNDREFGMHIQCRTWLSNDMRDQIPVATTNTFGARIGDNLLLPVPLRHLAQLPDRSVAETFFTKARELSDMHRAI